MADGKWKGEPTGVGWMMQNVFEPAGRVFGAASKANPGFYDAVQNKDNYTKKYGGEKTKPVPAATLDPKLYPDAVPGGYAITPQHARGADGNPDTTWLHPDLPGPKGNRVGKDYDPKQPGIQGAGDPRTYRPIAIDTTQNANAPIVTRSHNEEYVQKKAQWGDNPEVKAAADKGFEIGQAYRAGDIMAETPAYIRPGSDEYMNRADMKVWAEANPAAAAALRERGGRNEARIAAHEKRMGKYKPQSSEDPDDVAYREAGFTTGDPNNKVTFAEDPTEKWKALTGADKIYDYQSAEDQKTRGGTTEWKNTRMGNMIDAVQRGIMETRGGKDPRTPAATDNVRQSTAELHGEKANVRGEMIDIEESALTDYMDQNPGISRGEAVNAIKSGNAGRAAVQGRIGASGQKVPDEALDDVMERQGMKRNQAVDLVRSEEPMAHLEMGKRFTEPGQNRQSTYMGNQRAHISQAGYTGARGMGGDMQMPSGLQSASPQKAPLKYEQGNIHARSDEDTQQSNDHISAERFAYEANKRIGQHMFGEDYSPARSMPQF